MIAVLRSTGIYGQHRHTIDELCGDSRFQLHMKTLEQGTDNRDMLFGVVETRYIKDDNGQR